MGLNLNVLLSRLEPYREILAGIAVESTYNWYWLVDGLQEAGYPVELVNTAAVVQYEGLKYRGDHEDARWIAKLQHLGLLPTGWICPRPLRSTRDLLRKRAQLVCQRTTNILSAQSQYARWLGWRVSGETIKRRPTDKVFEDFREDPNQALAVLANVAVCQRLNEQVRMIERVLLAQLEIDDYYRILRTIPGVGKILAMTISLETGQISRFASAGNYASYCRCVQSQRISNGRKKGEGNRKNGNRYLGWAFQEAACFARQYSPPAQRWYQRKVSTCHPMKAWKALAHKLSRAAYYMMRDQVRFSSARLFG